MANFLVDLSTLTYEDTLRPQSMTTSTDGSAVDCGTDATALLAARLDVGSVTGFTSLDVKMQASPSGTGDWADISGATFTQVTAADADQVIAFSLPTALSATSLAYRYVRAVATLVGTSVRVSVVVMGTKRFDGALGYTNSPPVIH